MTAIATRARELALQVEAKKHALRQQQDGCWILTMKVHQNDMPEDIMKAAMGQRYVMAMVAVDDNEEPKEVMRTENGDKPFRSTATQPPSPTVSRNTAGEAERRKFSELPYSQQAALRCADPIFQAFLREMCPHAKNAAFARTPEAAAITVRDLCEVESRADIRDGTEAETKWLWLNAWFETWKTKERAMA